MTTTLKIRKYGDPVLRKKTETISEIDDRVKKLAYDMLETMYSTPGVGLAAPQVGVSLRLCIVNADINRKSPIIMINPVIVLCENKISGEEGCLSFPGFYENIKRYENIIARYIDLKEKMQEIKAQGFLSRIIQHEIDHLDAKLFIDYLQEWRRKFIERKIKRNMKTGKW
ncbi:MAG: peptide deformylase [Endomicrobium sp.]|jgi:peptide deformylase|nr:peptide deformylase [Endomicrobium sp.]